MNPLDYILASVGGVQLGVIVYLVYQTISAMKGERAALAVASINERAQRNAERQVFVLTENLTTVTRELVDCRTQLAATQDAQNSASKEHTDAVRTEVESHPDRAGDIVSGLLSHGIGADGAFVAPADSDGHPVATAVQPATVTSAGGFRRDP